ncbi:MAG: PEPxxWA-CTERM sorting domain-containing protein [Myxococcota bacterium]|nr:PEPxxWA-CTERM sorting domain-containing protein [Myxococcota bacterium]
MSRLQILPALLGLGLSLNALAAPVTLTGSTVTYRFDDALLGLFGTTYSLVGDTLTFFPNNFKAQSLNGQGVALTSATLNIRVTANRPTDWLDSVRLTEKGDYLMLDLVPPTGVMGVGVTGQLRVTNLDNPLQVVTDSIVSPALTGVGLPTKDWVANATAGVGSWRADDVNVAVENILYAFTTENVSSAFIEKKNVILQVSAVPEPEAWAMLLAGLGLVGLQLRRRLQSDKRITG